MLKVAVIGCGIVGPASALFLDNMGASVTLFDRVDSLKPVGAGILLQPAGLDVLKRLELFEKVVAHGAPITNLHGLNHNGKLVLDLHYKHLVESHEGLGIARGALYRSLFEQITKSSIDVINPCEIVGIKQTDADVLLTDNHAKRHGPFDCVIIADGANSTLRNQMNIKCKVKPYAWGALWAIAKDENQCFTTSLEQIYKYTHTMAGILPMGHDENVLRVSFFWSMHESQYPVWKGASLGKWKESVLSLWPKLEPILGQLQHHDDLAFARYNDVKTYPWHDGRIVLIGDAAHGMSPQLGQGANLGLIDAMVLTKCLSEQPVLEALSEYTKRRKSQLNYYQRASRFITPWFQSSNPVMGYLRDLLHGYFCKTPILKTQMLLTLACMKTGILSALKRK
jgi:2-polyprenyl-6-methoxyphenol hydroxylase-like FAD-dependent oxidoreductase